MQPLLKPEIENPLIGGSTITGRKDITKLSDEDLERELRQVAPRLAQTKLALDAARQNHQQMQTYAEQLLATAIDHQLTPPAGYQTLQTTSITIVGGADSIETIFRKYRGFLESSIRIDGEIFAQQLKPLIRDGQLLIDIPAKVEQRRVTHFDYDALGKIQPEIVIQPVLTHDPLKKTLTDDEDTEKKD